MAKDAIALARRGKNDLAVDDKATALITDLGKTVISDKVVAKIASIAAREIEGVHALSANGMSDTLFGFARKVTGSDTRDLGVDVEVGTKEAAIDLSLVVNYGVSIPEVAEAVRSNIIETIRIMTGLIVKEVNIGVTNLYFPEDDKKEEEVATRRVE